MLDWLIPRRKAIHIEARSIAVARPGDTIFIVMPRAIHNDGLVEEFTDELARKIGIERGIKVVVVADPATVVVATESKRVDLK